jgi:peptidylprolyl isomerase
MRAFSKRGQSKRAWGCALAVGVAFGCSGHPRSEHAVDAVEPHSGLKVQELATGSGAEAVKGKRVRVEYAAFVDGRRFDGSRERGAPLAIVLGSGRAIAGFEQGVSGMRVGGKRRLTIPPGLAYGESGNRAGPIPPNATVVFEVELLGIE